MGAFSRLDQRAILGPVYQDVKGEAEAMQGKPHILAKTFGAAWLPVKVCGHEAHEVGTNWLAHL